MSKAVVKPGRVYGIDRHPEGTILEVTSGEINFFSDWLAPVETNVETKFVSDFSLSASAEALMPNTTIIDVKDMVNSGELSANEVLAYETSSKGANRSSLIAWLSNK